MCRSTRIRQLIAALLLTFIPAPASSQCALCAKNAEFAGARPGDGSRTFARAAVVLLVPALAASTALGMWMRRHSTR